MENYKPGKVIQWDDAADKAFDELKTAIENCPKLFFLQEGGEVHLYTDASDVGLGGYVCQIINDQEFPIAFMSKSFTKQE